MLTWSRWWTFPIRMWQAITCDTKTAHSSLFTVLIAREYWHAVVKHLTNHIVSGRRSHIVSGRRGGDLRHNTGYFNMHELIWVDCNLVFVRRFRTVRGLRDCFVFFICRLVLVLYIYQSIILSIIILYSVFIAISSEITCIVWACKVIRFDYFLCISILFVSLNNDDTMLTSS